MFNTLPFQAIQAIWRAANNLSRRSVGTIAYCTCYILVVAFTCHSLVALFVKIQQLSASTISSGLLSHTKAVSRLLLAILLYFTSSIYIHRRIGNVIKTKAGGHGIVTRMLAPFLLLSFSWTASNGQHPIVALHSDARNAWAKNDFAAYITISSQILAHSQDPAVSLRRAVSFSALDRLPETEAILANLVARGLTYQIDSISTLRKSLGRERLEFWHNSFQKNVVSTDNSDTLAVLPDARLIPEGITADFDGRFFIGSLAQWKVLSVKDGRTKEFINPGQGGIWSVVGIKSYPLKNELWVCSASEADSVSGLSGLFCFDLTNGQLIRKYMTDKNDGDHFFNDLAITKDGNVFVSDSKAGKVWRYDRRSGTFDPFLDSFAYPNGITINDKNDQLYVADALGIHVVTVSDGIVKPLSGVEITYTTGIDGLYFYQGDLICIQDTGFKDDRVVRFSLEGDKITKAKVLQGMRPDFDIPTTGTIVNGYFYYIANSQLRNLRPDMTFANQSALQNSVVLRLRL